MMLMKTSFFLVALLTLQASAIVLQHVARSKLEILASRQTAGPCQATCAPFITAADTCTTKECFCTTAVATSLQACINCAVTNSPTTTVVSAAQALIDAYQTTCGTTAVLTIPPNSLTTTPAFSGTAKVRVAFPTMPAVV